jgi:hypothetical protein
MGCPLPSGSNKKQHVVTGCPTASTTSSTKEAVEEKRSGITEDIEGV